MNSDYEIVAEDDSESLAPFSLTQSDDTYEVFDEQKKSWVIELKKLTPAHRSMINMYLNGMKITQIAEQLGWSYPRTHMVLNTTLAQNEIKRRMAEDALINDTVRRNIQNGALADLERLSEAASGVMRVLVPDEDNPNGPKKVVYQMVQPAVRVKAITERLDRFEPTSKVTKEVKQTSTTLVTNDLIEQMKKRFTEQRRGIEPMVDAEFKEVNSAVEPEVSTQSEPSHLASDSAPCVESEQGEEKERIRLTPQFANTYAGIGRVSFA